MQVIWANKGTPLHRPLGEFASVRIFGKPNAFEDYTAMGVANSEGTIVASVVFYDYSADAGVMQMSGAADTPKWLTKDTMREMFAFPFDQVGCQSVVMRCAVDDKRMGRILPAVGFKKFILPRLRGKNEDEAVYILHDDVWRSSPFMKETTIGKKSA